MAKQIVTILTDDLDGKKADRTIEFGLDGVNYTIDLSETNAGKLRKALDPFISAGTRQGRSNPLARRSPGRGTGAGPSTRGENQAIREWARNNGHELSERGRIPAKVLAAYNSR
ncbi:histone-like nucleoid-structuring protein Lsr2 [Actinoplanes aureus]|uniref:Lsr2 family protein n=1 Tax=Actinoplanes aureus TaxID=2792083 RepID=A0A931CIN5_9ACTN|nr:Lsr2 family protein [Actinoplanes aureus]MBG0568712.1 Lsr2 family protein [Actinoplanes aureus]